MIIFVSSLNESEIKAIKKSHRSILKATGFYDKEEIQSFLDQIEDEKFLNLQDALSPKVYNRIYSKYFK